MSEHLLSRREFLKGTAGALGMGLLAACAPKTTPPPTEAPKAATEAPVAATEAPAETVEEPVAEPGIAGREYVMWGLQYDPHVERYNMLAADFEKKTGAKAKIEPQGWPIETKVLAALAAGVVPDLVCIMGKMSMPLFEQNAMLQVDDIFAEMGINPNNEEFFFKQATDAYWWNGHYYGVPLESNSTNMCAAARTDWIEAAGDAAKALWPAAQGRDKFKSHDEMWGLAEVLQQKDADGNVTVWGFSSQGWSLHRFLSLMRDLGKFWWDAENEKFYLNSDEAVEAMRILVTIPVFDRKIETQLDMTHMDAILAGKVAVACGNSAIPGEAEKIGVPIESVLAPGAIPDKDPLFVGEGGWGFEVPVQAQNQDIGIEFLKYMCTFDGQYIFSGIYGGAMPACAKVIDTDIYQGEGVVKRSKRRHLLALPLTVYWGHGFGFPGEMNNIIENAIDMVRTGELEADQACQQMQTQMEEHLRMYKAGELQWE